MPTYRRLDPPHEAYDVLTTARDRWHGDLERHEVTVGLLLADHGEDDDTFGPCLKLHGYSCAAIVKVTPYQQRVQGLPDAVIRLCARTWERLTAPERLALLDHELQHLEVAKDKDGFPKSDDHGRPKLRLRPHDWQLGGFAAVARRHKSAAIEVREFRRVAQEYRQELLPWADDMAGAGYEESTSDADLEGQIEGALVDAGVEFQRNVTVAPTAGARRPRKAPEASAAPAAP